MARTQATVLTSIWSDPDWLALSGDAQRTYLLLLTQPKLTLAGSLDLMEARWGKLCVDGGDVSGSLVDLVEATFIVVHDDELVIRSFTKNDLGRGAVNGNLVKGMWSAWRAIASPLLRKVVVDQMPDRVYGREGVDVPDEAKKMRAESPLDLPLSRPEEPQSEPRFEPQSEPASEPSVDCSLLSADCSTTKSQDYSSSDPEQLADPAAVDEQMVRKTARAVGRAIADREGADKPGAYAARTTERILTDDDPTDRDRIRALLAAGESPEDIAASWDPARPDPLLAGSAGRNTDPAEVAAAAESAKRTEQATAERLAAQRALHPAGDGLAALNAARAHLRAVPDETVEVSAR